MERQAHTGDTELVKSRRMTVMSQQWCMAEERRGKDYRKPNTVAPLLSASSPHLV
jgi:hypothetical protein